MSIFVGNDVSTARIFSIVGEVKQMHFNQGGSILLLGRPSLCRAITNLFWQQQVSVLEKVKLADLSVDRGLCIQHPEVKRWVEEMDEEDCMVVYVFMLVQGAKTVDEHLQHVNHQMSNCMLVIGDFVHCRVLLASQQNMFLVPIVRHYFIFAMSIDKVR
ncbi:hypothetical protein L208DRAFT_1560919, partial [Tricholoma matsutake]